LNPLTTSKTKFLVTNINSELTANSSQKTSNLEPTWLESDQEPNTIVIEYFCIFPKVTHAPQADLLFRSYDLWKLGCCRNSVLDRSRYLGKFGN
jgi:hypothetical protein